MRLQVRNFSCLQDIDVQLKDVTILIGEQGSGKSVLYKLAYYLIDKLSKLSFTVLLEGSSSHVAHAFAQDFNDWFPVQTWGQQAFEINLQIGKAELCLRRSKQQVDTYFNAYLQEGLASLEQNFKHYQTLLDQQEATTKKAGHLEHLVDFLVKELKHDVTKKLLGDDFVTNQLYVPAGRALFTSLSKAVSVLTESEALDEITKKFARIYVSSLENLRKHGVDDSTSDLFQEIFKGHFLTEGSSDFIETEDGRKIPLNILSSGQQEAFPLLALLCSRASRRASAQNRGGVMYVEELEAHLFPKAQGDLLELLVAATRKKVLGFDKLFISTHSPYVLSKLNNLLLAGQLHEQFPQLDVKLSQVVDQQVWLTSQSVSAYVLDSGKAVSIVDKDVGLIDGEYLDSFSAYLEEELSALMELEASAY